MSNPQSQGAQGPGQQQQGAKLLMAEDIPRLQCLSDDLKQKYRPVVQNFWNIMSSKPAGSAEYNAARQKLQEWSNKLINQERSLRARLKAHQQGNSGQPGQASQQPSQPANTQQQPPQDQKPPQQQQIQQPANPAQGARPQQGNQAPQIEPEIIKHVQNFKYYLPVNGPQEGTQEGSDKIKEMRNSYLMALNKQHKATQRIKMLNNMIEQRQKAGQEVQPEILTQKATLEKEYGHARDFVEGFRKKQAQNKTDQEQRRSQQQGQPPPAQQAQPPAAQQQRQPSQPDIKQEPQVKVEAQPTQQFGNIQGASQQPHQSQQQAQQAQQAALGPQAGQQSMRQPPTPHSQPNQPTGQHSQFAQPGQPQNSQQPPRPQINPHQANAMQHSQTNSPHPQSASAQGPPVPLSHQAAVSAAQRSYSNSDAQRTATPMQPGGQGSFHTPGSREREQLNNPKMPIPRQLNVTAPSPVGMGQARPTMSGPTNGAPGPMGQPVIAKFPPFQLEGEGDRVLSKRKLDELVRQVTGGSEEALTSEVEEAVLQLADDFVDTVISSACKLAKLRESTQLDIRDIQLVLERNYNIRIPGYASDEVRTVRRLVPAPGWTQKMNAVQAAKVMGGKTDI